MTHFQKTPQIKGNYKKHLEKEIAKDFKNYGEYKRLVRKVEKVDKDKKSDII